MITCASCGEYAILDTVKDKWGKLQYHLSGDKWNKKWVDICPDCINELLNNR